MSREVERLLKIAFAAQDRVDDDQLRALLFIVRNLAGIHEPYWYRDRWSQNAFKASIAFAIDRFFPIPEFDADAESPGALAFRKLFSEIDPDSQIKADPERFGKWVVDLIGEALVSHDNLPQGRTNPSGFFLSMPQVREVLGLEPKASRKQFLLAGRLAMKYMTMRDVNFLDQSIAHFNEWIKQAADEGDRKEEQELREELAQLQDIRSKRITELDRMSRGSKSK
jgi:hypothetical protein